jgi:hypothetical protein
MGEHNQPSPAIPAAPVPKAAPVAPATPVAKVASVAPMPQAAQTIPTSPPQQRAGLSPEAKLAIRDEVENRLNSPPASFDEQVQKRVERHLEKHLQKYKVHIGWISFLVLLILGWFGFEWKVTVPNQIREALERRNIGAVITNVVEDKVDEIAIPAIGTEITKRVTPTLLKLYSANDDNSQLLQAMNEDKTSYSNLFVKANNSKSPDNYLKRMLGTITEKAEYDANVFLHSPIQFTELATNQTMLDFSNAYYIVLPINPFLRCALLKQCWLTTRLSERDRVGFLISAMRYDNNMVVADTSAIILYRLFNAGRTFMNVNEFDNWFQNNTNYFPNHDEYVQWAQTNQFIKK